MQKKFAVRLSKAFVKQLEELEPETALDIAKNLKILEVAPLPAGKPRIKKIKGFTPPLYRLRVGKFRTLYRISHGEVVVLKVVARKELEKELKKFLG